MKKNKVSKIGLMISAVMAVVGFARAGLNSVES